MMLPQSQQISKVSRSAPPPHPYEQGAIYPNMNRVKISCNDVIIYLATKYSMVIEICIRHSTYTEIKSIFYCNFF